MIANAIEAFKAAICPLSTRVDRLPPIVLVFGGPLVGIKASGRQMFINWMAINHTHPVSRLIRTPEQYKDWNQFEGYSNLVDFEIDAGNISQAIVLFSESAGSFAELGAFSMDAVLSERLLVVIDKAHYKGSSFIAFGPIKKVEGQSDDAICVVDNIHPDQIANELADIAVSVQEVIERAPKTHAFDPKRPRDQFLAVADLVELFGALTKKEVHDLIKVMGVDVTARRLEEIINQLIRFELLHFVERATKRFLVSPTERSHYLDYQAPAGGTAFHRDRFKLTKAHPALKGDVQRFKAYSEIHRKS